MHHPIKVWLFEKIFELVYLFHIGNITIRKHSQRYEFDIDFVNTVLNSFYVDDFTGGENDFEKVLDLYKKLKIRFLEGLFHLRKWRTNHQKLRKLICGGEQSLGHSKSLGVIWDEQTDNFIFDFAEICKFSKGLNVTKGNVLKILAMFYDPIGVLQPIMINFKILFQQICRAKIQWAEEITSDLRQNWDKILHTLENIGKISIPRNVVNQDLNDPIDLIELHGFSDVNLQNYGASIYIGFISKGGNVSVNLTYLVQCHISIPPENVIKPLVF